MTTLTEVCDHCGQGLGEHLVPDSRCPGEGRTTYFFMAAYHPPSPYISPHPERNTPMTDENIDNLADQINNIQTEPDWTPWEDETVDGYLLRLISQSVWQAGEYAEQIDQDGRRGPLWKLADAILDYAYPPQEPTEIDIAADQ
jgi:hypothetical protein